MPPDRQKLLPRYELSLILGDLLCILKTVVHRMKFWNTHLQFYSRWLIEIPEAKRFRNGCSSNPGRESCLHGRLRTLASFTTNVLSVILYKKRWNYHCNRPWRPIGLWDEEAATISWPSAHRWQWVCQPYTQASVTSKPTLMIHYQNGGFIQDIS
jgi:hypothetical protein